MRRVAEFTAIVVLAAAGLVGMDSCARAEAVTVRVVRDVPTVAGIVQAPAGHEFYRPGRAIVAQRPAARVLALPGGGVAPPNGCAVPAFEVVSGPKAERGCYGALR